MAQSRVGAEELEYLLQVERLSDRVNVGCEIENKQSDFKGLSHQKEGVTSNYDEEDG